MKKIHSKICFILALLLIFSSCDNWLDVDQDPNAIVDSDEITEAIYITGVEAEWTQQAVVLFVWWNGMKDWLLWYAGDGTQNYESRFEIEADYGIEIWEAYSGALMHSTALYDKAKENGNKRFQAIGATISAWHWFNMADYYDQAPLDEAMRGDEYLYPDVNSLEEIYSYANGLLDEAIVLFTDSDPGSLEPSSSEDYIYGADYDKWVKLCYSLKARYAMRLTYMDGTTEEAQAGLALQYLEKGMTSNDDMCAWEHTEDLTYDSYIYEEWNNDYSGEGMTPSLYIVDLLNGLNDPRRPVFWTEAQQGGYEGIENGGSSVEGSRPSRWSSSYCVQTYPDMIMTYSECLFLKAEAYALKGEYESAQAAMKEAVRADMEYHNVGDGDITTYLAQDALELPSEVEGAQETIITQKYIANVFETTESYFDFIRTGYPKLDFTTINQVINTNTFPRRNMYPSDEMDSNPYIQAIGQPDYFNKGAAWDAKSFSWR